MPSAAPAGSALRARRNRSPSHSSKRHSARLKPKPKGDEIYLNQVLNNRFKIESKIGEGGFGAVYRGTQLATGRQRSR